MHPGSAAHTNSITAWSGRLTFVVQVYRAPEAALAGGTEMTRGPEADASQDTLKIVRPYL